MVSLDATALSALFHPQSAGKGPESDFAIPGGSFRHTEKGGVRRSVGFFEMAGEFGEEPSGDGTPRLPVRDRRRANTGHLGRNVCADGLYDGFDRCQDHAAEHITGRE
jgi:hypothetical protein